MKLLDVIDSFFSELEGNQRLRIGSYLVLTLVAISTIMELKDANRILTMQYRSLDETKFDLESVDEDSIWRARHEKELEYKLTYTVLDSDDKNLLPSIDSEDTKMIPPDEDSSKIPKLSLVILLSFFFFGRIYVFIYR